MSEPLLLKHIVIVGAGAAGVALLVHLSRRHCRSVRSITMVDVNRPGYGLAFGHRDADVLCNTSVDVASVDESDPGDFGRWLHDRGHDGHRDAFVPRGLVAQYLHEHFHTARQVLQARGVAVTQISGLAETVTGRPGDYLVRTTAGPLRATDVAICAGAAAPVVPDLLAPHTDTSSVTIGPYPVERLTAVTAPASRVLIIGTRLSAVDAALVLARQGHHVTLTSPSGQLPAVRTRLGRPTRDLPAQARLAALEAEDPDLAVRLMRIGVEHIRAFGTLPLRHQRSETTTGLTRLAAEADLAARGNTLWQELAVDLVLGLNQAAWVARLSEPVRAELEQRYRVFLTRYFSAMPLVNARKLLHHHHRGRLVLATAFPSGLTPTPRGWRADGMPGSPYFDHIVSAAGHTAPSLSLSGPANTPIHLALTTTAATDTRSMHLTDCSRLHRRHAATTERIWVVGMTAGKHLFAPNFLLTNVKTAARTAACLNDECGHDDRSAGT